MKKVLNKKIIIIFIVSLALMLLVASILLYFFLTRDKLVFKLIGEEVLTLDVYEQYNDPGIQAIIDKEDVSSDVIVDYSLVDTNKVGTYEVIYKINYDDKEVQLVRTVKVVDSESPVLTLKGNEEIVVEEGNVYQEPGCNAVDNYDPKVNDKIQIINHVNTNVVGVYEVVYTVVDDSGNKSSITRQVVVKPKDDNEIDDYTSLMSSNQITNMSFIDDGVYIEGYVKDNNGSFKIKVCKDNKKDCVNYDMNKKDDYYYYGNIKLSNLDNGTYYMWIESKIAEKVVNKLDMQYRIVRAKLNDKLVTFNYDNDNVTFIVDDFAYQYDILIDPGHGGSDPGASNETIDEKQLNLIQSLYEKERYEEHGLKVLMLRNDLTYGMTMGESTWPAVRKKAYALGFYGVVSKITYSNHHNSSLDTTLSGWEIIVPATSNKEYLSTIYKISDRWANTYNTLEEHTRVYTRNYNTGTIFSKENNDLYYFTDYYAVLRLPYQLFNVNNVLFEGSYLSNKTDFEWYYTNNNWKKLSEDKIKTYVEALGIEYIEPK